MKSIAKIKLFICNKLSLFLILILSLLYLILSIRFQVIPLSSFPQKIKIQTSNFATKTTLSHVVFGIASTSNLWNKRKSYIKLWWKPNTMRGFVWLEKPLVKSDEKQNDSFLLPPIKISSNTSNFKYTNPRGRRSAIRISRIVSESVKLKMQDVRWYVMGDDDTFFVTENLVRVLEKLDHDEFYYVGSNSETHVQNIDFSYNMAFGGGGFAISHALAKALAKMQDSCLHRYPNLYGSDDRIQACVAELGVPLTKHSGFHQCDVLKSIFGLLAAHPVTPLISLHHLDIISPIFPNAADRVQALSRLTIPMKLDAAALAQQSICYEKVHNWTVSVSWGYAVQIFQTIRYPRELERPARTFTTWQRSYDPKDYAFNTRTFGTHDHCEMPAVYLLSNVVLNSKTNRTESEYLTPHSSTEKLRCTKLKELDDPSVLVKRVEVHKAPDPNLWFKSPRRNCCRIVKTEKNGTMVVDVGPCVEDE
ncbi:unnamed protein product [Rhodiola kirilowii]